MVKRKASRIASRARPVKPPPQIREESDECDKENNKKRLEDFDMQVKEILEKMEKEKQAIIDQIKNLYFCDSQRTSSTINKMLWVDYLKQNDTESIPPRTVTRQSILDLIDKTVEETKSRGRKKNVSTLKTNFLAPKGFGDAPATATRSRRGQKPQAIGSTPLNPGLVCPLQNNLLITPKFDPRTPLPLSTLRKPRVGEIAVSLKGSPLQVKPSTLDCINDDISHKSKEELEEFHDQVAEIQNRIAILLGKK